MVVFGRVFKLVMIFSRKYLAMSRKSITFAADFRRIVLFAALAELVDVPDLGSGAFGRGGSSPLCRTDKGVPIGTPLFFPPVINNSTYSPCQFVHHHAHLSADNYLFLILIVPACNLCQSVLCQCIK